MELTKRFLFRGNASALSGQIFRPKTVIVDMDGASSLGVSGGRSHAEIQGRSFGDAIRFGSAMTLAEGLYDDEKLARAVTNHKGEPEELNATTNVVAEIRELVVGQEIPFTAKRLRAALVSRSPRGSGEPSIAPGKGSAIQGVDIGGFGLDVALNASLFQKLDTRSKVAAAADDPKMMSRFGVHFVPDATVRNQRRRTGLIVRNGIIYTTIVQSVRWAGKPFPGATIDGHVVTVPDFGKIYFGELLVGGSERRLTMARFELGSEMGGWADGGGVDTNGSFYP
jgi:hypothetical protein